MHTFDWRARSGTDPKRLVLILLALVLATGAYLSVVGINNPVEPLLEIKSEPIKVDPPKAPVSEIKDFVTIATGTRVVSAYTLGNPAETDDTPCIGAYGHNLCEMARAGVRTCASNEFPAWTKLQVGNIQCLVLDRMNEKYPKRVDIAFMSWGEAIAWGLKTLPVSIIPGI